MWIIVCKNESQQHLVFPGGLPSKYYPGPTLLNFGDLTRTGAFNVVWPLTEFTVGKRFVEHQERWSLFKFTQRIHKERKMCTFVYSVTNTPQ